MTESHFKNYNILIFSLIFRKILMCASKSCATHISMSSSLNICVYHVCMYNIHISSQVIMRACIRISYIAYNNFSKKHIANIYNIYICIYMVCTNELCSLRRDVSAENPWVHPTILRAAGTMIRRNDCERIELLTWINFIYFSRWRFGRVRTLAKLFQRGASLYVYFTSII